LLNQRFQDPIKPTPFRKTNSCGGSRGPWPREKGVNQQIPNGNQRPEALAKTLGGASGVDSFRKVGQKFSTKSHLRSVRCPQIMRRIRTDEHDRLNTQTNKLLHRRERPLEQTNKQTNKQTKCSTAEENR
jgi:hypothetical protein